MENSLVVIKPSVQVNFKNSQFNFLFSLIFKLNRVRMHQCNSTSLIGSKTIRIIVKSLV